MRHYHYLLKSIKRTDINQFVYRFFIVMGGYISIYILVTMDSYRWIAIIMINLLSDTFKYTFITFDYLISRKLPFSLRWYYFIIEEYNSTLERKEYVDEMVNSIQCTHKLVPSGSEYISKYPSSRMIIIKDGYEALLFKMRFEGVLI